jgi:uncharacterized protein
MSSSDESQLLELLRAQHDFPGPFTFKVICRNIDGIAERIRAAAAGAVELVEPAAPARERASTGARFVSLTLDLVVRRPEHILELYRVLRGQDGVISCF